MTISARISAIHFRGNLSLVVYPLVVGCELGDPDPVSDTKVHPARGVHALVNPMGPSPAPQPAGTEFLGAIHNTLMQSEGQLINTGKRFKKRMV